MGGEKEEERERKKEREREHAHCLGGSLLEYTSTLPYKDIAFFVKRDSSQTDLSSLLS